MPQNAHSSDQKTDVITTKSVSMLSTDALDRRRLLLSSLSKGSVVVAAASVPMHTLASDSQCQTDDKNRHNKHFHATASRCTSPIGSRSPSLPISQGYGCSHYQGKPENWPGYSSGTSCYNKTFKSIFKDAIGGLSDSKCKDIVNGPPTTAECRWVVAYLNAHSEKCGNLNYNYPYNQSEIKQLFTGGGGLPDRATCQTFFGTFMETKV